MESSERYRVLILGDVHFGESYPNEATTLLERHGYGYSTSHLQPFVDACDYFVLNLETPLVNPNTMPSPLRGQKTYVHWGDPENTVAELQRLGVDAVSLANNHTLDYGAEGLEATFESLTQAGIEWFGAGDNLNRARKPHRIELPKHAGGGEFHFHGGYEYSTRSDVKYGFYAGCEAPGCAPLKVPEVPDARVANAPEDSFQIAFPHWGGNYAWRGQRQFRMAHRFLRKDYDLVLGHGAHSMQEICRKQQRWVVYGLGNGVFNSAGRWSQYEEQRSILPFSFWTVLEVSKSASRRKVTLKLYPVHSDNLVTEYRPGPVSAEDFSRIIKTLGSRPARPWRFANPAQSTGSDDLGLYIELQLGEWPVGQRPARLEPLVEDGDPGDWQLRGPSADAEDRVLASSKNLGPSMLAMPAKAEGANVRWLSPKIALLEYQNKRFLAHTYRAHESALGASIVKDKVLTAELLTENGVATPKTVLVASPQEAVEIASQIPGPIVLKPRNGNKSKGVSTSLVDADEIRSAFFFARKHGSQVILQQHIDFAEELRVMASSESALAVNGRVLPHVIGDGSSNIRQLIEDKNLQRMLNPSLRDRPIPIDELTHRHLRVEGLTLDSIPNLGERVIVRNVAGLSVGGDTFQDLEGTSEDLKRAATAAIAAIPGLGWGGVDLIVEKGTGRPFVIEVNHSAAYGAALFPAYGTPRDVGTDVWHLRHAATPAEPKGTPLVPPLHPSPLPAVSEFSDDRVATFGKLFEDSLLRQGFNIVPRNSKVLQVSDAQGFSAWVTRSGLTTSDRSAVQQAMQRHNWIYELLEVSGIPLPRAEIVSSSRALRRFVKGRKSPVHLAPAVASWNGVNSRVTTSTALGSRPTVSENMWVQTRPVGRRVRILATRDRAWVVTAKTSRFQLDENHIASAGQLAVQAIRAVPELRWATVSILLRPKRIRADQPGGLLVEGLTLTPSFTPRDRVFAGDFDAFCHEILTYTIS